MDLMLKHFNDYSLYWSIKLLNNIHIKKVKKINQFWIYFWKKNYLKSRKY